MQRRVTSPATPVILTELGSKPEEVHVFEEESVKALNAALAARRPLLIRGEPGVGKSQLARAAAAKDVLNCPFLSVVIDSTTESRELLWTFDAVHRLAEAQISGALGEEEPQVRARLEARRFVHPGILWWAFHWASAKEQAELVKAPLPHEPENWSPGDGCVVLIDEIDKAESEVPNGLLEALGDGVFHPRGIPAPIEIEGEPPLVVITTNEERVLPDAFLRRCLVHDMSLPANSDDLTSLLVKRGLAHFGENTDQKVLEAAAELLVRDRREAKGTPIPGQAEFLDLVRIVVEFHPKDFDAQKGALDEFARFVLEKDVDASR